MRVVARHHLFGSDELSARAEVVAPQLARAYAGLSAATAAQLNASEQLNITLNGQALSLPVQISDTLADGAVSLPQGYAMALTSWATLAGDHA